LTQQPPALHADGPDRVAAAHAAHMENAAIRAASNPVALARAARIIRAALKAKLLSKTDLDGPIVQSAPTPRKPLADDATTRSLRAEVAACTCYHDCRNCSLSGDWHVHPGEECPVHPEAPGDRDLP